jgi:hypothetical protein
MIDMFSVAGQLATVFMRNMSYDKSASYDVQKKAKKKQRGQEEFEKELWTTLQKAVSIREGKVKKRQTLWMREKQETDNAKAAKKAENPDDDAVSIASYEEDGTVKKPVIPWFMLEKKMIEDLKIPKQE